MDMLKVQWRTIPSTEKNIKKEVRTLSVAEWRDTLRPMAELEHLLDVAEAKDREMWKAHPWGSTDSEGHKERCDSSAAGARQRCLEREELDFFQQESHFGHLLAFGGSYNNGNPPCAFVVCRDGTVQAMSIYEIKVLDER